MNVKLQAITPEIETTIVEIARVSSSRMDKKAEPEKLLAYLIRKKHWSPFEHGFLTMEVTTSRAICTQFLRHRSFTFQQFSQRYAKVTGLEEIVLRKQAQKNRQSSKEPVAVIRQAEEGFGGALLDFDAESLGLNTSRLNRVVKIATGALDDLFWAYDDLLEMGIAKETARFILPLATETTFYMTGPVRSWIHMLQLRDDTHAQLEAQEIARAMKAIFCRELPIISKALGWTS